MMHTPFVQPRLRPGEHRDAEAMATLHARCWREAFGALVTPEVAALVPAHSMEQSSSWFGPGATGNVTVAEINREIVGYAAVSGRHLVHLFVDPDRSRRGIGRTLLADAEDRIAADGHPVAELHTRVGNEPAIALYLSSGWELTDAVVPCDDHGTLVDEHVLVKRL